jgi:hypothetical protein
LSYALIHPDDTPEWYKSDLSTSEEEMPITLQHESVAASTQSRVMPIVVPTKDSQGPVQGSENTGQPLTGDQSFVPVTVVQNNLTAPLRSPSPAPQKPAKLPKNASAEAKSLSPNLISSVTQTESTSPFGRNLIAGKVSSPFVSNSVAGKSSTIFASNPDTGRTSVEFGSNSDTSTTSSAFGSVPSHNKSQPPFGSNSGAGKTATLFGGLRNLDKGTPPFGSSVDVNTSWSSFGKNPGASSSYKKGSNSPPLRPTTVQWNSGAPFVGYEIESSLFGERERFENITAWPAFHGYSPEVRVFVFLLTTHLHH